MEWISIKDRLPENYQTVLCYGVIPFISKKADWYRSRFYIRQTHCVQQFISYGKEVENVTNWMIPEPPTE